MAAKQKSVFVSYAHEDRKWADELVTFMAPWIRDERVDLWDDSRIESGQDWKSQIDAALGGATVAVLLVSKSFLASPFIARSELPQIIERALAGTLRLVWVAIGHSGVDATALHRFQAANDIGRPLDALARPQREKVMAAVAKTIADAVTIGTFANGLQIIDRTTEPLQAALEGRPEAVARDHAVRAEYDAARDRITFSNSLSRITVDDLDNLPMHDREFIADLNDSLERNYKRWAAVRRGLGNAAGALDDEVEEELDKIVRRMCKDLNHILDFIRQMHKSELEDHYGRYRYLCQQFESR